MASVSDGLFHETLNPPSSERRHGQNIIDDAFDKVDDFVFTFSFVVLEDLIALNVYFVRDEFSQFIGGGIFPNGDVSESTQCVPSWREIPENNILENLASGFLCSDRMFLHVESLNRTTCYF